MAGALNFRGLKRSTMYEAQTPRICKKEQEESLPGVSRLPRELQLLIIKAYARIEPLRFRDGIVEHPLLPPKPESRTQLPTFSREPFKIYEGEDYYQSSRDAGVYDDDDDEDDSEDDGEDDHEGEVEDGSLSGNMAASGAWSQEVPLSGQICRVLLKNTPYIGVRNSSHWPPLQEDSTKSKSGMDFHTFLERYSDESDRAGMKLHITCAYDKNDPRVCGPTACMRAGHAFRRDRHCSSCDKAIDVMEILWHKYHLGLGIPEDNVMIKLLEPRELPTTQHEVPKTDQYWDQVCSVDYCETP